MNARLLPLAGFAALAGLLGFGIWLAQTRDAREVPSPLIGKPAPEFSLPTLDDPARRVGSADLRGKPYLLNVFASWCFACVEEHPVLMREGARLGVRVVGFNYKDEPDDARRWLERFGNPYETVVVDHPGQVAIDFGVYGAPETFLVDAQGVVRYKRIGPLTPEVIARELAPKIAALGNGDSR